MRTAPRRLPSLRGSDTSPSDLVGSLPISRATPQLATMQMPPAPVRKAAAAAPPPKPPKPPTPMPRKPATPMPMAPPTPMPMLPMAMGPEAAANGGGRGPYGPAAEGSRFTHMLFGTKELEHERKKWVADLTPVPQLGREPTESELRKARTLLTVRSLGAARCGERKRRSFCRSFAPSRRDSARRRKDRYAYRDVCRDAYRRAPSGPHRGALQEHAPRLRLHRPRQLRQDLGQGDGADPADVEPPRASRSRPEGGVTTVTTVTAVPHEVVQKVPLRVPSHLP